ncbi:MAG TPA: zinc-binding alcohol dehydrogenase, partial [Vicinamibacterales bacterium]|nr:zinc-binding alcohol dehydrogenase [Vicinamibacterales bacterium]
VWDAEPFIVTRLTVIGAGTVGCLVAFFASRVGGCDVELVDIDAGRAAIARELGVRFAQPESASAGAEAIVHTSGSPSGLELALNMAGFEATIVDASWYGDRLVTLPLGGAFHSRRLTIKSSQVGAVAPSHRARCDCSGRMQLALESLKDAALDALITGESAFDDLPRVMPALAASPGATLCHRIRYV